MSQRRAFWDAGGRAECLEAEEVIGVCPAHRYAAVAFEALEGWGKIVDEEVSRDSMSSPIHQESYGVLWTVSKAKCFCPADQRADDG